MKKYPFTSIVVPVYNGEKTIEMCVQALLKIDWPEDRFEIIIVDNKSTDRTCEIVERFEEVILLHEEQILTASGARNRGILHSKGEIIAFTDADCRPTPRWLKELLKGVDDQKIGCFIGEISPLPAKNVIENYFNEDFWHNKPKKEGLPCAKTANCAYRKSVFERIGLFDAKLNTAEDSDLLHRFATKSNLKWVFNEKALVEHKNKDTLEEFIKQFLRAGAWREHLARKWPNHYNHKKRHTILNLFGRIFFHVRGFIYRFLVYPFHKEGEKFFGYQIQDKKYHLVHPLLMIIVESCSYLSSKFPNKFR